ncbi:MAG: DNA-binding protein [Saprospirales bacterium]|nr:MAG: DNA-binding protein [Saprospirales bacterium]
MQKTEIISIHPNELTSLIAEKVRQEIQAFAVLLESYSPEKKTILTRKETSEILDVSFNCLNDWRKKGILIPFKIGQRTYYRMEDIHLLTLKKASHEK